MSSKIKLAALIALLTALSVHGTAFAQSNRDISGHGAGKAAHHLKPKMLAATVYVPLDGYGSAAPDSVPTAPHRSVSDDIVNKRTQIERDELRRLDDPDWILCHDLSICRSEPARKIR